MSSSVKTRATKGDDHSSVKTSTQNDKNKDEILWPEWNDADVNAEKWDTGKAAEKAKPKNTGRNGISTTASLATIPEAALFEDLYPVPLPASIKPRCSSWIRISTLISALQPAVYTTLSMYPDLVTPNRHILQSEFIRSFIASVNTLLYLGYTHPFPVEWQTPSFNANTSNQPWQPWHHVYSMCRAGGDAQHNPNANNLGKYIVRLFWMGFWRKIVVDDRMPVDSSLRPLLPCTATTAADIEFEIWPMLLTKALMKIASLTWTATQELLDFDIITCLTGWVPQAIDTRGLEIMDVWEICKGYTDHYTWDEEDVDPKGGKGKKGKKGDKGDKTNSESTSKTDKSKKDKSSGATSKKTKGEVEVEEPCFHLVAVCQELGYFAENAIPDITPCCSHGFLIEQTRDIPILKPDPLKALAEWKKYRWVDWAVEKGLIEPIEPPEKIKYFKVVSNLRKTTEQQVFDKTPSVEAAQIRLSVDRIDNMVGNQKGNIDDKDDGKKKTDKGGSKASKKTSEKDSKKGSKKDGGKKGKPIFDFVDPSIWCSFYKLGCYIDALNIYLKPSKFTSNIMITNITSSYSDSKNKKPGGAKKDDKKGGAENSQSSKRIQWCKYLQKSHNEPIYIFMDSIDYKFLAMSLSHVGNRMPIPRLRKKYDEGALHPSCEKNICKRGLCIDDCKCRDESEESIEIENTEDKRTAGHMIAENYNWKTNRIGNMKFFLNTYGIKSILMDCDKGRIIWRIWLTTNSCLVLTILSDINITVGTVEEVLESMSDESERILETSFKICTAFGDLVKCFGVPEYPIARANFFKSYIPDVTMSKKHLIKFHDAFMREFLRSVYQNSATHERRSSLRALRIIFLDPTLAYSDEGLCTPKEFIPKDNDDEFCKCVDIDELKRRERAAVTIQAFFKMIYLQKLKEQHISYMKGYPIVFDILRKIYMMLFSNKVRLTICPVLIRNLIEEESLQNIKYYLPYTSDVENVIVCQKVESTLSNLESKTWIPITRFVFNVEENTLVRIYIKCNLQEYNLRVFNNDDPYDEINRYTNDALVSYYKINEAGYTVLAYGWTGRESVKQCPWRVTIVTKKINNSPYIRIHKSNIDRLVIKDEYIPNLNNQILRCLVKIKSNSVATFRLNVSTENVKICLRCTTLNGRVLSQIFGVSYLILPFVILQPKEYDASKSNLKFTEKILDDKLQSSAKRSATKTGINKKKRGSDKSSASNVSLKNVLRKKSKESRRNMLEAGVTEYIVDAFVIDDTWPLTKEEWQIVEERKAKNYIQDELIDHSSPRKNKKLPKLSKISYQHVMQQNETPKSKEKNVSIRKGSIVEEVTPNWTLIAVYNTDHPLEIEKDMQRIEEIKEIKKQCFNYEISRLLEGKQLRQEFLERNCIRDYPSSCEEEDEEENKFPSYLQEGDDQDKRTKSSTKTLAEQEESSIECPECDKFVKLKASLLPKKPESCILPEFILNKKLDDDFRRDTITKEKEVIFEMELEKSLQEFLDVQEDYLQKTRDYFESINFKKEKLQSWYEEIRSESVEMLKDAEKDKDDFILRTIEEEKEKEKAEKDLKKEKGKKGKK